MNEEEEVVVDTQAEVDCYCVLVQAATKIVIESSLTTTRDVVVSAEQFLIGEFNNMSLGRKTNSLMNMPKLI